MSHLRGRVSSVTWRDEFTGETCARIAPEGPNPKRVSHPFLGMFAHGFVEGELITVTGDWELHPRHGKVFRVSALERRPPSTREGEVTFLTGYIAGITKGQASLLLDRFGGLAGLIDVCRTRPQALDDVLPKARKVVGRLRNAQWDRREIDVDAFVALQSAGLKHTQVQKLVRFFGANALRTIAQNTPYDLCQVPSIGFQSAEKVAEFYAATQGRNVDLVNEDRLIRGLCEVVARERQNGHVCAPESRVIRAAQRFLKLQSVSDAEPRLKAALETALKRRLLLKEFDLIYPRGLHKAESELALHLSKLMSGGAKPLFMSKPAILRELRDSGLSVEQQEGVCVLADAPVSILVGGPGRGKTRTLQSFVALLEKNRRSYTLMAPTGKAAKRASEVTGKPCLTIHKACGLDREEDPHDKKYGRKLGRRDRFNVDVLIIDEASMIDLALGFEVVRRIKPGRTAIVFVGDPDQLPPVSAGQVLMDLLAAKVIPTARLTQVFRQANGSPIVDGADALNTGRVPAFADTGYEVRLFDPVATKAHPGASSAEASTYEIRVLLQWLSQAVQKYSRDLQIDPLRDIQVYAPQRSGPLGLEELNRKLQALLNPPTSAAHSDVLKIDGGFPARVGDKVMQVRNNYRMRLTSASAELRALGRQGRTPEGEAARMLVPVMNGQVGYVTRVDAQRLEMEVKFDDFETPVLYLHSKEWRQLAPAYAMSIHRSQGSETPYAFILLHDSMNPRLVNRPLIYTAWTRAKSGVAVFANRSAVERAAANMEGTDRYSGLARRLAHAQQSTTRKRLIIAPPPDHPTVAAPAPTPAAPPLPL